MKDVSSGSDRLEVWKFRDCECADTAFVGARRPCTALLGHRVRKWNARDVIARPITTLHNGASPNFTACDGVGVGEDAVKKVSSGGMTNWKFRDAECAESTFVGAGHPCKAFLGRRVRKSYARNVIMQAFTA